MYLRPGWARAVQGRRVVPRRCGSFLRLIPRGSSHCFQNVGDGPARLLVMFAPAGMERFFEGQAALPDGPVDPEACRAVTHNAMMCVVGPPLADTDPS